MAIFIDLTERATAPLSHGCTDEEAAREYRVFPTILRKGDLGLDFVAEEYVVPDPVPQDLDFNEDFNEDELLNDDVVSMGSDLSDLTISTDSTRLSSDGPDSPSWLSPWSGGEDSGGEGEGGYELEEGEIDPRLPEDQPTEGIWGVGVEAQGPPTTMATAPAGRAMVPFQHIGPSGQRPGMVVVGGNTHTKRRREERARAKARRGIQAMVHALHQHPGRGNQGRAGAHVGGRPVHPQGWANRPRAAVPSGAGRGKQRIPRRSGGGAGAGAGRQRTDLRPRLEEAKKFNRGYQWYLAHDAGARHWAIQRYRRGGRDGGQHW